MTYNFDWLSFTIFRGPSFKDFTETIANWYVDEMVKEGKAIVYNDSSFSTNLYANPQPGAHLERFSWWESALFPNAIFFISNLDDGFMTLCHQLRETLRCEAILCRITKNGFKPYSVNDFYYVGNDGEKRYIRSMKEERWEFFEMGEPLPFEDLNLYRKKYIRDRMNMDIILMYLKRLGISFEMMDKEIKECMTFERTKW